VLAERLEVIRERRVTERGEIRRRSA
jgi:hypothetical protein